MWRGVKYERIIKYKSWNIQFSKIVSMHGKYIDCSE